MIQYTLRKDEPINVVQLGSIVSSFMTNNLPLLKQRYNYYLGKQKILLKVSEDPNRPCNNIVCNFVKNIVNTYEGYAVGIPVTYASNSEGFDQLENILRYNDVADEDAELFRNGLIFGRAAEICYLDENKEKRFKTLDSMGTIPVYDDTLEQSLLYAIRIWKENIAASENATYLVQVYDDRNVTTYRSSEGFASFQFISQELHGFLQVPVTFFSLNTEEEGIADTIFSLQDAYNSLISDSIDDWDAFCDAYLVLKGAIADGEDLENMKAYRTLMLDADASAEYLVKNTSSTEIEHLMDAVEEKIREMSACPNFASENFGTSSGIAIRYRCMALENNTASILNNFKKALQRRIELLSETLMESEALWRDVDITFTRNLPINTSDIAQEINQLRGLVSDRTLLAQLPFIDDVDEELEEIHRQKLENLEVYTFGTATEEVEDGEEAE